MNALTFTLLLTEPVLVSRVGSGEENSSVAYTYIPGSAVRGAVISLYMKKFPGCDISQSPDHRRFFFDEDVRYINAYPLDSQGNRALPVPLSWKKDKDLADIDTAPVYDFAVHSKPEMATISSPRSPFVSFHNNTCEWVKLKWSLRVHNASEDRFVKKQNQSTVYRYDAIAPDQKFGAAVLAEDEKILSEIKDLISVEEHLFFGGSRSAGYGCSIIQEVKLVNDWTEYQASSDPEMNLVVTFLSDAVIRNPNGEYVTNIDHLLEAAPTASFARTGLTGGFNRKWGLPLTQMPVVQAGSVCVYPNDTRIRDQLQTLLRNGVGERRNEGFGRIALNLNRLAVIHPGEEAKGVPIRKTMPALSGESRRLAEKMAAQRLRAVLDRRLVRAVAETSVDHAPNNAQLSRLRQTARWMLSDQSTKPLSEHLENMKSNARNQLKTARVGEQRLFNWLESITLNDQVWETAFKPPEGEMPAVAGVAAAITPQIKVEYLARLLDSLMRKASRSQ